MVNLWWADLVILQGSGQWVRLCEWRDFPKLRVGMITARRQGWGGWSDGGVASTAGRGILVVLPRPVSKLRVNLPPMTYDYPGFDQIIISTIIHLDMYITMLYDHDHGRNGITHLAAKVDAFSSQAEQGIGGEYYGRGLLGMGPTAYTSLASFGPGGPGKSISERRW